MTHPTAEDRRAEFEALAKEQGLDIGRYLDNGHPGDYYTSTTYFAWRGYIAGLKHSEALAEQCAYLVQFCEAATDFPAIGIGRKCLVDAKSALLAAGWKEEA